MAHIVTPGCLGSLDGACAEVCPVDCFYWNKDKALNEQHGKPLARGTDPGMMMINPDECIDCDACVPECPTNAIFADTDTPSDLAEWVGKNAEWTTALTDEQKDEHRRTTKW